jgi:hypothetical protein
LCSSTLCIHCISTLSRAIKLQSAFCKYCTPVSGFFLRLNLLNTEPSTSIGCPLKAVFHVFCGPVPQGTGTPLLLLLQTFNLPLISVAVLKNVSLYPRCRVTEKRHLFNTKCRSGRDRVSNPCNLRGRQWR